MACHPALTTAITLLCATSLSLLVASFALPAEFAPISSLFRDAAFGFAGVASVLVAAFLICEAMHRWLTSADRR